MKSIGEIHGEIHKLTEQMIWCSPEKLILVRERIKTLQWVVRDLAKGAS